MTRFLLCAALFACVLPASASSPRLDALAGDGLLLEDSWADHLWPGSLGDHHPGAEFWLSAGTGGNEDKTLGFMLGSAMTGSSNPLRWLMRYVHRDAGNQTIGGFGLQIGRRYGDLGLGIGYRDDIDAYGDEEGILSVGLRWAITPRDVLDVAFGRSWREDLSGDADDLQDYRARFQHALSDITVLHLIVDHGRNEESLISREDFIGAVGANVSYIRPARPTRYLAGFTFWPDADSQIVLSFLHDESVFFTELSDRHGFRSVDSDAVRISFEARFSYWLTWRLGLQAATATIRDTDAPRSPNDPRRRLLGIATGTAVHLGSWDLEATFRRKAPLDPHDLQVMDASMVKVGLIRQY